MKKLALIAVIICNQYLIITSFLTGQKAGPFQSDEIPLCVSTISYFYSLYSTFTALFLIKSDFSGSSKDLDKICSKIDLNNQLLVVRMINERRIKRRTIHRVLALWMPIYSLHFLVYAFTNIPFHQRIDFLMVTISALYITWKHLFLQSALLACCDVISIYFDYIYTLIRSSVNDVEMNSAKLAYHRLLHSNVVELVEKSNELWKNFIPLFAVGFLSIATSLAYNVIYESEDLIDFLVLASWMIQIFIIVYLVIRKIIFVNVKAHSMALCVYQHTLFHHDFDFNLEVSFIT